MDPYKIMGVAEGTIRDKTDLEKVRQRSKELYKRYASEKEDKKAKRVIEAFEVIKTRFKKKHKESSKKDGTPASSATPTSAATAKPGHAAVSQKHDDIQKQLASLRRTSSDGSLQRTSSGASVRSDGSLQRTSSGASVRQSGSSQKPSVTRISSDQKTAGNSSTIRTSGSGVMTLIAKKPDLQSGSNGKKRPSSQEKGDIFGGSKRHCEARFVAPVQPPQNGAEKQGARLICKCTASYGANRFQGATGTFLCPSCRLRGMDPLNVVMKGSKGMLTLKLVQRPLIPDDAKTEASFKFKVDFSQIKEWRKKGDNVEARMCRLDSYNSYQTWPSSMTVKVNGKSAFEIKEAKPGHKRRDLPHRISANLKPGVNAFEVSLKDTDVQKYALALVRTSPLGPREICKTVPCVGVEDCKQRVTELLFSSMLEGCVEDFQAAVSDRSRLICPISIERIRTPARGKKCRHLQCFDLEAYLVSNQKMAAINKRWLCPICDLVVKPPGDLFIDTYVVQILAETGERDEEVAFDSTASWTVTSVAASPAEDSEDELPVVYKPPSTEKAVGEDEAIDDDSSDVAIAEDPPGSPDQSPDQSDDVDAVDPANAEDNGDDADVHGKEDDEIEDRPSGTGEGEPSGSPLASSPANWGSNSPESEGEPECHTDPYMMMMKEDDDVDEDFVATLRDGDQSEKSSRSNGHSLKLSMSMIATPAPLASPAIGSPGEAADEDET